MNREETLALYAQGREAWNAWADAMLAARKRLEDAGAWQAEKNPFGGLEPQNDATRAWMDTARADFSSAARPHTFEEAVHLRGFVFPGDAWFGGATFSGDARFDEATFSGDAWFDKATFSGLAWFDKATFSGLAWFDKATFSGDARFDEATFSGLAWFTEATFSGDAWFGGARFSGTARFGGATFSGLAWFDKATFSGTARFDEATFAGAARFDKATFSGDAGFAQAHFEGFTSFDAARFERSALFTAMQGDSFFSLSGADFDVVPDFEQAHFAEAPRLDISHFRRGHVEPRRFWWSRKREVKEKSNTLSGVEETARWRALKRLAAQGHDHEREQLFFARELKSLRGSTDFPFGRNLGRYWFGRAYEAFSDFGRSMLRPLVWWIAATGLFALLYLSQHFLFAPPPQPETFAGRLGHAWHATLKGVGVWPFWLSYPALDRFAKGPPVTCLAGGADGSTPVSAALAVSLRKGLLFAGFGDSDRASQDYACLYGLDRKLMAEVKDQQLVRLVPDAVAYLGLVQTLFSAVLLFLLLLALRNQFRIR